MIYCYQFSDGGVVDMDFPMGEAPEFVKVKGRRAKRCFAAERKGFPPTTGYPFACVGSGVNANQADDLRQHLVEQGVPTEVTPDGDPVYRNPRHRRKALKARGMVDKNSFL